MAHFTFVPFGSAGTAEAICCDGLIDGCGLHLSHWAGNRTPVELKRDTSVEIALSALDAGVEASLVVNNHFDADGVLAAFCLLHPVIAAEHRAVLVAAAEAGDFGEWSSDEGLKLEMAVRSLASGSNEAEAYERVLSGLPGVLRELGGHADLWSKEWDALVADDAREPKAVTRITCGALTIVVHHEGADELAAPVLWKGTRGAARILHAYERADERYEYRYTMANHAWADTVVRPAMVEPRRNALVSALGGSWTAKGNLGSTGLVRTTRPVSIDMFDVAERLLAHETAEMRLMCANFLAR